MKRIDPYLQPPIKIKESIDKNNGRNIVWNCTACGKPFKRKDYRKTAAALILCGILLFPILLFIAYGTIVPFMYLIINIIIALFFVLKKERYTYFCKSCQTRYSEDELKNLG
ncbi:MAG: hypothetical protein EX341_08490 [Candidatus Scalindua sp. SCAELEC01]|nr:hypothetical protein [Planctomycetota bacterium]RZV83964.1 MAG: hypothetical protein EX341_08490 [Candidatus Scalindua sp. SCAELEC01]